VIVHYDEGFLITLYAYLMSHALYMTLPFTFLSSLILIVSGAGTIYEAIHYVVFSNFLLLSAIKVYRLISTVPKTSLISSLSVIPQISTNSYKSIIQGVTGGMCETSGECSLGQTIPI